MAGINIARSLGLVALACGVCCLPIIVPMVAGGVVVSGGLLAGLGQGTAAMFVLSGAAVGIAWWRSQRRGGSQTVQTMGGCGCDAQSGCNAGDSCDLPDKPAKLSLMGRIRAIC